MTQAGYRDTVGNWLAKPSRPLEEFDKSFGVLPSELGEADYRPRASGSGASVLFVRESKLMKVRGNNHVVLSVDRSWKPFSVTIDRERRVK